MNATKPAKHEHFRQFRTISDYRDKTVKNSIKNYDDKVIDALTKIYTKSDLTVYDFERAFVSKLLSDDLVEACNMSKSDEARSRLKPQTGLRLTKAGCKHLQVPYEPE